MTIEERAELAVETFAAGKGNCTQSVLCAWEDKISVDHDTLMKLGAGYGAGMGCMQATCGALIGAVMALCFAYQFSVLVPQQGIGWQAHVGGVIGGIIAGWLLRERVNGGSAMRFFSVKAPRVNGVKSAVFSMTYSILIDALAGNGACR